MCSDDVTVSKYQLQIPMITQDDQVEEESKHEETLLNDWGLLIQGLLSVTAIIID